jgi:hypothetical protein
MMLPLLRFALLLLAAGLTFPSALPASAATRTTRTNDAAWLEVKSDNGKCPNPSSYCTAKLVDSAPTVGVANPQTGKVLYGVLFQKIQFQIQWIECVSTPAHSYNNTFEYYEAFPIIGPPGLAQVETDEDTFQVFSFSEEAFQLATGNGKYVRATASNVNDLIRAFYSLPGRPNANGNNFIQDPNGSGDLTVPGPGGLVVGKFDTGAIPNGTDKPSAGDAFNWDNDFNGSAVLVSRFALQLSICCNTNGDLMQFNHIP